MLKNMEIEQLSIALEVWARSSLLLELNKINKYI